MQRGYENLPFLLIRIFIGYEFAKAISGGDKSKFELLKSAIEEGFGEAAKVLGGKLPEISQKTYDLVMDKLDKWIKED